MPMCETPANCVTWKWNVAMTHLARLILLLMPLAGCTGEGAGGPIISSLSKPMGDPAGLNSDQSPDSDLGVVGSDGDEDPVITMTPTSTGVTAHLTWDRPPAIKVAGYRIHYGKHSSEEPKSEGASSEESRSEEPISCFHGESQSVEAPTVTITGLEPNTPYFFAISVVTESESLCSNEIIAVTPPAHS
jgi:Fibronectin type III domain